MADTILMIHGMWGGPWYWENYQNYFERRGYHCVIPALPYHDAHPAVPPSAHLGTTGLIDYANAIEWQIRQLDTRPVLMGHSMGGLLAQMLASRGLAESIVLLAPASPAGILGIRPSVIRAFWSVASKWGFWRTPMRQTFHEAADSMLHLLPREEQMRTYLRFVSESGRAFSEVAFWFFDPRKASSVDHTRVTCPVLVIAGAHDRMTPPPVVRSVAKKYRATSTYKEFAGHAHWLVGEPGWEDVANEVYHWLVSLDAPPSRTPSGSY